MKGTIIERNGSYRLRVSLGKNPQTGKYENYFETYHGDKPGAQRRLRELLTQLDKGIFIKPEKQSVDDYLQRWLKLNAGLNKTHQGYSYNVNKYISPVIGQIPLNKLNSQHIQTLCAKHREQGHYRTAKYIYQTLHKALNDAVASNILYHNPCSFTLPKVERHEWTPMT
jgi:hypothetical protein